MPPFFSKNSLIFIENFIEFRNFWENLENMFFLRKLCSIHDQHSNDEFVLFFLFPVATAKSESKHWKVL